MKVRIDKVLKSKDGIVAISRESPFYPDGKGGQLGDRGEIGGKEVLGVYQKDGLIHHVLDGGIEPGEHEAKIDEKRRKEIARQHTAQHILSAAFIKVADIETVSFHMGEDFSTIDLNAAPILENVIDEAEELANEVILENRLVLEHIANREEAERYPLRKPISEKVKGKVRIIEVKGFDWSACGGFHVSRTGEIGLVKVINYEKVKGSLTRIYFVAGKRALHHFSKLVKFSKNLSRMLTSSIDEMESRISNMIENSREKSAKLDKLAEEYAKVISSNLLEKAKSCCDLRIVSFNGYEEVGKYLFKFLGDEPGIILIVKTKNGYEIGSKSVNVGSIVRKINTLIGSKGGGSSSRGRIATEKPLEIILQELEGVLVEESDGSRP